MRCIHKKHLTTHKQFLFSVLDTFEGVKLKDKQTWNLAISGCVNGECLKDAEEVLELACLEKVANSASYQIVIEGHLEVRDEESAHKIFKKMLMDNVAADMGVYETFMQYYIKQKEYKASETIKRLWQGILLSTDDNRSINLDIAASLTKYYRNNNNLEEAEQLYLDLKSKKQKLNTVYVNELCQVIIQFIGNRQYLSAVSLYCDLIGHGYTPIPETTDRIMQSSKANKYLEAVDQILNNFQK